jgi:type VI secretion system secreted protein VgrG
MINSFSATEELSQLFTINVELVHEEDEAAYTPTVVDPKKIIGQGVTITVGSEDGTTRQFVGMINRFTQGNRQTRFSFYNATIVPHIWLLTQKSQSQIFQQISVPDILRKLFSGFEVRYELQRNYEQRNYCVQYRESDFAFASRLMEEEGIFYFFEHSEGKETMILADTPQSHRACPVKSSIPFFVNVGDADNFVGAVNTFLSGYQLQTGKVTLWDHNFQLPGKKLENEKVSRFKYGDNDKLELYDFPGGYGRKYDGVDKSGGAQDGELQKVFSDRDTTTANWIEQLDSEVETAEGLSDCCSITAGYRFSLLEHPNLEFNQQYTIVSALHEAEQSPAYVSNESLQNPYKNSFKCIAHGSGKPGFRPPRTTPKPYVRGSQTAYVVGPAGEEIFVDKYGRVKVQFNWDRTGKADSNSSCWVRVVQSWAGKKWGTMFIPRIGMEVMVDFLEGDPDQPIITGCVYNPDTMPPYVLPDEKTKSTIKTNSSKGSNGFNELRFEDKKGSEQIFIHAEKDKDIRVKNDCKEIIGHDRHLIVENEQLELVKKDKHLKVKQDHNEQIDGTMSLKVGVDQQNKVGNNYAVEAGMSIHIKAGMSAVIEAGTSLTLKVGGSSININPAGIQIIGSPMLMLNSGGSAGSGAGCSPNPPKDAKEADNADPGANVPVPKAPAPLAPTTFSPLARLLRSAAKDAAPFCDI